MPGRIVFDDGEEAFLEDGVWTAEDPAKVTLLNALPEYPLMGYAPDPDIRILEQAATYLQLPAFYEEPDWVKNSSYPEGAIF